MNLKFQLIVLLCLPALMLCAQRRPSFLQEDIQSSNLDVQCLCRPGVYNDSPSKGLEISWQRVFGSTLEEEEDPLNLPYSDVRFLDELQFSLKAPVVLQDRFKVLLGWTYQPERYSFDLIGPSYTDVFRSIDGKKLKNNAFSLLASASIDHRFYVAGRFRIQGNGDYGSFISLRERYRIFAVSGLVGIKEHDDFEWGIGLNYSSSFRSNSLLPFLLFNKTFNERWGIEAVFPAVVELRHNLQPGSILMAGLKYNSRSYSIDVEQNNLPYIYEMNHSELRFELSLEQRLHPWVWINVEGGLQYNFSTDFDTGSPEATPFQVEMGSVPYIQVGVFLSPPANLEI